MPDPARATDCRSAPRHGIIFKWRAQRTVMTKVARNSPCPCGSGKKHKRCCQQKETDLMQQPLPAGRFRYESGSYGGPSREYFPSIICYKETDNGGWTSHFCLVKPDTGCPDEDSATRIASQHLAAAQSTADAGGGPQGFAMSLRHAGYKNVPDFQVVSGEDS
ncbi:MAG: SEC-C domain-containing protein [Proteobacteria bacterium]|nr:SEC-C domain-containing protein [Pseudomonadota bacterium]MBU1685943.1 SEC-C domain-containing protein [Pseudomonadota bacterium]